MALEQADKRIRTLITLACAVCCDETPIRVGPRTPRRGRKKAERYLLVACTEFYTLYLLGDRDLATFKAFILADLTGVVVHDPYFLYDHHEVGDLVHQLCVQHYADIGITRTSFVILKMPPRPTPMRTGLSRSKTRCAG